MKNKYAHAILIFGGLTVLQLFVVAPATQASVDTYLDGQVKIIESKIDNWERTGREIECLTYAVVAIGIIVAASQASNKGWIKFAVGALGLMSALIVAFTHIFFSADDRAYQKVARQARSRVQAFNIELAQYTVLDEPTRKGLYQKFAKLIQDMDEVENATIYNGGTPSNANAANFNLDALFAASARADQEAQSVRPPDWAQKLPTDDKNLYFLGVADGTSFELSRANALAKARDMATDAVTKTALASPSLAHQPNVVSEMARTLAASAEVAETFTAPTPAGGYRSFTLLRLSRSAAVFTAQSVFVQSSVPYDKPFLEKVIKNTALPGP